MTNDEKRQAQRELDKAYDEVEKESPDAVSGLLRWLRTPESRWLRIPLGVFFVACSFFWFMPIVGIEFLPIGLLLLAQDMPFLRKPVARFILWLEQLWCRYKRRREPGNARQPAGRSGR